MPTHLTLPLTTLTHHRVHPHTHTPSIISPEKLNFYFSATIVRLAHIYTVYVAHVIYVVSLK